MRQMLLRAVKAGFHTGYMSRLLGQYQKTSSTTVIAGNQSESSQPLIEPLSGQELKVLRLLNTHLSVPEIAREMVVAPSTIRTHVRNIYEKIGVHGRIEALEKAEELGLL